MSTYRCCKNTGSGSRSEPFGAPITDGKPRPPTFARRCRDIAGWVLPGAILALLPKCPACLAAYVAAGTGLGLSLTTATYLRTSLLILCVASVLYLLVRLARHIIQRKEIAP